MTVGAVAMGGIERVIAEHVLRFLGNEVARDAIDVLIVPEGKMNFVEAAVRFVDSVLGLILGNLAVRVGREEFGENNIAGVSAADREGVAHNGPLRLTVKA